MSNKDAVHHDSALPSKSKISILVVRRKNKTHKKRNWYKQGGTEAVFFVPSTPNGQLAQICPDEFKKSKMQVKVVERAGTTVKKSLVKSNLFAINRCNKTTCQVTI